MFFPIFDGLLSRAEMDCKQYGIVVVVDWRDFEEMQSRHEGKQHVLDDLMETWINLVSGSTPSSACSHKSK